MKTKSLKTHYDSSVADRYESSRQDNRKWCAKQNAVETLLDEFPAGIRLLDAPVGTGRFLSYYAKRKFVVDGVDISEDMLRRARQRLDFEDSQIVLRASDIFRLDYPDASFDVAVCIRFLNLVSARSMRAAILELSRVSRSGLIVGIRHMVPIRELRTRGAGGIIRCARQIVSRVVHRARGKVVFHHQDDIQIAFRQAQMSLVHSMCIEHRRDGTEYHVYFLQPAPIAAGITR